MSANLPDFSDPDLLRIDEESALQKISGLLDQWRDTIEHHLADGPEVGWSLVLDEARCSQRLERFWSALSHLHAVADNDSIRASYNACLGPMTEFSTWRQQNEMLCSAYRHLRQSEGFTGHSEAERRLVELELRDFHLAGVDLPEDRKSSYRDIVHRLSEIGALFGQNLLDATHAWHLHIQDSEDLDGLPGTELALLAGLASLKELDGWVVDLSFPAYLAVMKHASNRELRREVYTAYVTRASDRGPNAGQWDNSGLIDESLSLRYQLARLMDFDQYVDFALEGRMADSRDEVNGFLLELAGKAKPMALEQLQELSDFAESQGAEVPLQPWDITYWSEALRKEQLNLSDDQVKPYLPLQSMVDGLLYVVERMFGARMVVDASVSTWHEDVVYFWLVDPSGNRFAGLYMDLYTRPGKRDGAWMDVCRSRMINEQGGQMPVAYLNCNFPPPVETQPSLLTHHDVCTLFHEAGHCMHHVLTRIDLPQVNGITNVEWDAVELPSQLFENWAWEKPFLERFARHHETGESLPDRLLERMLRGRKFQKAMALMRQIEFAMVDLRLHSEFDPDSPPAPLEIMQEVRDRFSVVPASPENRFLHSFGHIFGGGYAAGYYSYLWAEVLAADAWDLFEDHGGFNPDAGAAFRKEVLEIGASRPAIDSFRAFRGRKPRPEALLESYGLAGLE